MYLQATIFYACFCDICTYVKGSDKNVDLHRMDTCRKLNKQAFMTVDHGN